MYEVQIYGTMFIATLIYTLWPAYANLERNKNSSYYFKEAQKRILKVLLRGLIVPIIVASGYFMKNSILNEFSLEMIVVFSIFYYLLPVFGVIQAILFTIARNDK